MIFNNCKNTINGNLSIVIFSNRFELSKCTRNIEVLIKKNVKCKNVFYYLNEIPLPNLL